MASCSDGTQDRQVSHSDELLHIPFRPENSKFLITKESKSDSRVPSKIFKVEPPSVLRRVKDFLPKIKEAEEALQKELEAKSPSELDIENVEDAGSYIEMSLAMVETQADGSEGSCEESNSIDVNSDGDSDEIQTQEMDYGPLTEENFVIRKTANGSIKPVIEEITKEKTITLQKKKKRLKSKKDSRKGKKR